MQVSKYFALVLQIKCLIILFLATLNPYCFTLTVFNSDLELEINKYNSDIQTKVQSMQYTKYVLEEKLLKLTIQLSKQQQEYNKELKQINDQNDKIMSFLYNNYGNYIIYYLKTSQELLRDENSIQAFVKQICNLDISRGSFVIDENQYQFMDTPKLNSLSDAMEECRNYGILSHYLQKFLHLLKEKCQIKKIPLERYLLLEDFEQIYILQDLKAKEFKICIRKAIGKVIKYNSNWGYISPIPSIQNYLVQAFTIYTYVTSKYMLMINNISVCGNQIVDYAINNYDSNYKLGPSDNQDMGFDGISRYMINLDDRKHLIQEILDLLDIDIE
ncbi:hypothetical protein pb186bvf_020961 [Paramecium bursaria]